MWAFILGGAVAVCTVVCLAFIMFANMMSDNPYSSAMFAYWPTAVIGFGLAALIVASHWLPHISW